MIKRTLTYIIAALTCIASVSCKKDTTLQYDNMTMGNVTDGTFVSDQGNIFNVVEQDKSLEKNLLDMERAYILCDVLNKTEGGLDNEYDIRLKAMVEVRVKEIIALGTETEAEKLVEDPAHIEYAWFSGGYLNLYIIFPIKENSETPHMVNLVQQETENGYTFKLTHNSYGENLNNGNPDEYVMAGAYISFPVSTLILEDTANVKLEWTWHKSSGTFLIKETEQRYMEGKYVKGDFKHGPKTMSVMTKAAIK